MMSLYLIIPLAIVAAGLIAAAIAVRRGRGGGSTSSPGGSRGRSSGADKH